VMGKNAGGVKLDNEEYYILSRLSRQDIKINANGDAWLPVRYEDNEDGLSRPVYGPKPGSGNFLNFKEKLTEFMSSDAYLGLDPGQLLTNDGKISMIKKMTDSFNDAARAWIIGPQFVNRKMSLDENGGIIYRTDVGRRVQLRWQNQMRKLYGDERVQAEMESQKMAPVAREGEEPFFEWQPAF